MATSSCSKQNTSDYLYTDENGGIHIEVEKIIDNPTLKKDGPTLSSLVDSITYIKLGSANAKGELGLLRNFKKIFFTDNNIIANDSKTVLLFDNTGNLIRTIGYVGGGPNEYLYSEGTAVDEKNKKIYIGCYNKVVIYDFDNKFINSFTYTNQEEFDQITFLKDGMLLLNHPNDYGMLKNKLSLIDSVGNILKTYPNYYNFTKETENITVAWGSNVRENFYKNKGVTLYKESYNDTINSFDDAYNLKPYIHLNMGKYTIPIHLRLTYLVDANKITKLCNDCYNTFTTETDRYFIIECRPENTENNALKLIFCDKTNGESLYMEHPIINDIDNGLDVVPSLISSDGKYIYMTKNALDFKEEIEKMKNISPALAAFEKTVSEDDNRIIMKLRLK